MLNKCQQQCWGSRNSYTRAWMLLHSQMSIFNNLLFLMEGQELIERKSGRVNCRVYITAYEHTHCMTFDRLAFKTWTEEALLMKVSQAKRRLNWSAETWLIKPYTHQNQHNTSVSGILLLISDQNRFKLLTEVKFGACIFICSLEYSSWYHSYWI